MATVSRTLDAELMAAVAAFRTEYIDSLKSLPLAGNNRPPLPTDPYALGVHKAIVDDDSKAARQLFALWFARIDDGMAWHEVIRGVRRMESSLAARYAKVHATDAPRPLPNLIRREQRTNQVHDLNQMRVLEGERTPETLRAAITSGLAQIACATDEVTAMQRELVSLGVLRSQPRRVYGGRRPSLQVCS